MKKFLVGFLIGICLPFAAAFVFITRGVLPVPTKSKPLPFERLIAGRSLHAAMAGETGRPCPLPLDETNLRAGARIYQMQCAVCHGHLGQPPTAIAKGMFPRPPQLLPPRKGVTDDEIGETYWKVKNGIRLTGMPGFADNLTETEMWQVSLLLLHAHELPASVSDTLHQ